MKIEQSILNKRTNRVVKAISSQSPLPILSHIKLSLDNNVLEMVCTDLEKFIIERITVNAPKESFSCCVPGRFFSDLIGAMSGEIDIKLKRNTLYLDDGSLSKVKVMETMEFPIYPELPDTKPVTIKSDELVYLIANTIFAAAKDENRPTLNGVYFEFGDKMYAAAADGYRMSYCEYNLDVELPNVIIPVSFLSDAIKILNDDNVPVDIYTTDKQMIFELPETRMVAQLIEGNFPDVNIFLSETHNVKATLKTRPFLAAIKKLQVFAKESSNVITMEYYQDKLALYADGEQTGDSDSDVDATVSGSLFKTAFNGKLMIEALSVVGDEIVIKQNKPMRPVWVCPANREDEVVHIVMPMDVRPKQDENDS